MKEIDGFVGEMDGVRVIVTEITPRHLSGRDMLRTAVELIQEEL